MKKAEIQEKVMFYDTDCGGVVSNIAYLRYVERARTALFEEFGMTVEEMNRTSVFPVVARTEIDYLRSAKLGNVIAVRARVARFEKVKIHCEFDLFRVSADDEVEHFFAKAVQQVVLVQLPSGRPRRVPAEWLEG